MRSQGQNDRREREKSKGLFYYLKTQYKIQQNKVVRLYMTFALANLYPAACWPDSVRLHNHKSEYPCTARICQPVALLYFLRYTALQCFADAFYRMH